MKVGSVNKKEKDTFSNEGNFSIHIHNINLKAIEQQSNHCITKDIPIFCYVQENKQNFIAKFKDNQSTIHFTLDTTTQKDEDNHIIPQNPKNIFLSFIPFKDNQEANHTIAQKLQLTTQDLNKGYKDINFKLPLLYLKDCEMFREWSEEIIENKEKIKAIKITNKNGDYLFSIEQKDITENTLVAKNLYDNYGLQWFETSAEKYHKLLDVNPDLKDKQKCEKLGVLYFTWEEIVEFADLFYVNPKTDYDIITNSLYYFDKGSGDWKQSQNGAKGYLLVSMEGIPYWADAVGQIPFAINTYKGFYEITNKHFCAKNATINIGYIFAEGGSINEIYNFIKQYVGISGIDKKLYDKNLISPKDENSYDNKMILRAINYTYLTKYSNNQSLSLDSKGTKIYEK